MHDDRDADGAVTEDRAPRTAIAGGRAPDSLAPNSSELNAPKPDLPELDTRSAERRMADERARDRAMEDNDGSPPASAKRWAIRAGVALGLASVVFGGVYLLSGDDKPRRQVVTSVTRVALPPPPPPPPKIEPPPEPTPVQETPRIQEPTPKPAEAPKVEAPKPSADPKPPGDPLTGELGTGANNYGIVAGAGGGNAIGGGGGGGGGGLRFAGYARMLEQTIRPVLQRNDKTNRGRYQVVLRLWVAPQGTVSRAQVESGTTDPVLRQAIEAALIGVRLSDAPPADMPQPVRLRIGAQST